MGGEAERPAQGVGEGEDTERYAEGGVARYGEGADAAEEDEAHVDLEVGVAEGERTPRGEGGVPKSDPMAHQRAVDWERRCGKKAVPPETTCTPSSSKSVVPDRASTSGSLKRKKGGAQLSGTSAGKRLRQQKMTDTYGGEWIGEWRKAFFRWVCSSGIAFNAFRNTPYWDLQQVALRQPGGAPLPVLPSHSEIADMRTVKIHREQLAEELEEVRQPLWVSGATLLSDGRKSRDGRPIVNFLVAGSRGVVMYTTISQEGEPDDTVHVLQRWVIIFHDFRFGGPQRVNAICTDSASAYVGAARALASPSMPPELRRITWLPCCVHVCNKLLSDIGTICTSFVDTITRARVVVVFFKTHQAALSFFRKRSEVLGLVLSCETRFASVYSMLERLFALQDRLQGMMTAEDGRAWARIPWSPDVCDMARWVRRQIRWSPWWERMRAIKHIMDPVMDLLRRMDRGGQFMSLVVEWTRDLARLVRDACIPLGKSFSDRIMRRVQTRIQHMLEPAHCAAFLLNPRRQNVQYFSAQLDRYHTWLVRQAKRYLLSQTGHDESGGRYLERDEGMLDAQAGLDVEPVRSGTRNGMTEEEIQEQAALIARDPIGSSAPPPVESVFGARATIFRPYPRDDDSADERESEAADGPMLPIPHEIDELHEGGDVRDERKHTALRAADERDMDMMGGEEFWGSFGGTEERSPTAAREDTRPCTTLREETPAPMTASEEPGPAMTVWEWTTVSSTAQEQTPAPMTTREQTSIPATHSGSSSLSPLSPRQLVLDPGASSDLGEMGVHSGAPPVEERERRAEEHGAAGAGGGEGIQGMEEEVAGVVGGVVEVDDDAHVGREEGVLPSEVEREDDVVRMQEATMRDDEGEEAVAGVDESVAGVDDGAAQVEMEEDVVRADAAALVGGEEGVVGGDIAHGTGEGGAHLDPIVQRFVDDEMGPALAGLTPGTRRALGASPSGQRGASGLGMGDFMDMSLGDPPTPAHAEREDVARALAAAGYSTQEIEQAFAGRSGRETDSLQQGCEEVVEQPQEEREDAPPADIHGGSSSLVPFTGLQMTTTMRPVRPCVQGSGSGEEAFVQVPLVIVVDLGSEVVLRTADTGRRAPQDTARPLDFAKLARAAVRDVTRREDTDPSRPLIPPPPPRSRHSDYPSTPVGRPPRSPSMPTRPRVRDTTAVGSLPLDTSLFGRTDIDLESVRRVTVHTARQQPGLGGADPGRGAPREVMAAVSQPRDVHGVGQAGCTLQAALAAAARAVREHTSHRCGVVSTSSMPQMMPATGDAALEESSGAEGLEMPRGSRREKTVAEVTQVSARFVRVRTGAAHVTVVEDDPETEPAREEAAQEGDEYRDDEEREEEESDNGDDDSYHDDDDEPSPPPRHGSRR
ncbi:hypothetical protein CBR_g56526 [Chara braunii]|uniref:DUF659 domain-containing protein n=1 Tax=Chara braunii TaxID=69332 RepID=A0A388MDI5_CHABU|nr:hypothetical protein CBR_g56526 [Chara braunii]|eukprot:GBG92621.1 hypothetical protein CBR_g56526 [Chara braunii]